MASGGDKRRAPRVRRRVQVVFDHDRNLKAQTTNLSRTGLCVSCDYLATPGTEVGGALMLPSGAANFEAVVVWARKVRAGQSLEAKNTMGLAFSIPPGTEYDRFVDEGVSVRTPAAAPAAARAVGEPPPVTRSTGLQQAVAAPDAGDQPGVTRPTGEQQFVMARHELPVTEPVVAAAPVRRALPAAQWASSPMGLLGRSNAVVEGKDLAAPAGRYSGGLALCTVAGWVEQAAMRCLAGILPSNAVTVGVSLQVTVAHEPAVLVGDKVAATVRISEVSADGQMLTFELRVDDGRRALAAGTHTRQLLLQRKL